MLTANNNQPWSIVLLTCRAPETDFRFPLARELAALGHVVEYIYVRRHPVVTTLSPIASPPRSMSLLQVAGLMRRHLRTGRRGLVLNSTNLVFPGVSLSLRLAAGGLWCLDLHDDLLYERTGWARLRGKIAQSLLLGGADMAVHAAPTLVELFPHSHHLGNASDLVPLQRGTFQTDRVLVLASLDGRFDFDLLAAVARICPKTIFDVYGQISKKTAATLEHLNALTAAQNNIVYHGAYTTGDLPGILAQYSVTLAPYVARSRLTHYIDPLRFYHCLNSGMEVVSTDIPPARVLAKHLTILERPEDFADILARLGSDPSTRKNQSSTTAMFTWKAKAVQLVRLVDQHMGRTT